MELARTAVVDLLRALGVDTADGWDAKTVEAKINRPGGVNRYVPEPPPELEPEQQALLDEITAAQAVGAVTVVEDAPPAPTVRPRTPRPPKKAPEESDKSGPNYPKGFAAWPMSKKEKYWKTHPRAIPEKGKAAFVIKELRHAGKLKKPRPLTKEVLLERMKAEFPDDDAEKMEGYLQNLVPVRLKNVYGLTVSHERADSGRRGYYILPEAEKAKG